MEWFWICPEQAFDQDLCIVFGAEGQMMLTAPRDRAPNPKPSPIYYGRWSPTPNGGLVGLLEWEEYFFSRPAPESPSESPEQGEKEDVEYETAVPDVSRPLPAPIQLTFVRAPGGFRLKEGDAPPFEWLPSELWIEKHRGRSLREAYRLHMLPRGR